MIAANPCQQRHPNSYLAESVSEVQDILNPRLGDIAIISTAEGTSTYRLREPEDVPAGASSIPSNKCEYVWVLSASPISGLASVINVDSEPYNAAGNGITDDTASIQMALNDGVGNTVYFGPGKNYKITSPLTVGQGTTVIAYGSRVFNSDSAVTLFNLESGARVIGMEVEGIGNASFDNNSRAFMIQGVVGAYKSSITIQDCYVHGVAYGVYAEFAEVVTILNNRFYDMAFAGVMGHSVTNMWATLNHIKGVTPGSAGTAYGISYTRHSTNTSLAVFPRSKSCKADSNIIEDIPLWEALDTHAGEDIQFIGNTIRNCAVGIAMVTSHFGGVPDWAPQQCRAFGNTIYGNATNIGIALTGAWDVAVIEYAQSNTISGNTLINCGDPTSSTNGSIYFHSTRGTVVSGNTVRHGRPIAVISYHDNLDFTINDNTIEDPWSDTITVPSGIALRAQNQQGTISGNSLSRVNAALGANVAVRGIWVADLATSNVIIGKQWNNFTVPYVGAFPAINSLTRDEAESLIDLDPTNDTIRIGGPATDPYKVVITDNLAGSADTMLIRNATAAGSTGINVKSDTTQGWLQAFSDTHATSMFRDRAGIGVTSITPAMGFWASGAGQTADFFIGSANLTIQIDGNDSATESGILVRLGAAPVRVKVGANGTGPGGVGRALYVDDA